MEREVAKELFEACERTIADLAAMEAAIGKIEDPEERATWMRSLGTALAEVLSHLRGPVVRQYPDLEPPPQLGEPDTVLNPEELLLVCSSRLAMFRLSTMRCWRIAHSRGERSPA